MFVPLLLLLERERGKDFIDFVLPAPLLFTPLLSVFFFISVDRDETFNEHSLSPYSPSRSRVDAVVRAHRN